MAANKKRVTVTGSGRTVMSGAKSLGLVPADERFEITVRLRPSTSLDSLKSSSADQDVLPGKRKYMSREEFAAAHGADPQDAAKVADFAKANGLVVLETNLDRRSMVLSGMSGDFSKAFGTTLHHMEDDQATYRGRTGELTVPEDLGDIIEGVFGLDDRPQARPKFQQHKVTPGAQTLANPASFLPPQLASAYKFPPGLDGTGQTIAIIELGGGYRSADLKAYFKRLKLPTPKVKAVRVDGGKNAPTNVNSADVEVLLDIEVAAALAPKATIVVYFAPNTTNGFLDAITKALHDTVNKPSVISISWGGPESSWTGQALTQYNQAFQAAASLGVSIFCAAGDNGSADGVSDGKQHADFPASSPYVTACGGTKLLVSSNSIASETVWNEGANSATGGGVSDFFPLPTYQANANIPVSANPGRGKGRGVPDVAGDADPASGYIVRVDGQDMVVGGTSAVAPLWAGLTALLNQKLTQHVGFLNPLIYGSLSKQNLFNDITAGNNGAYQAGTGWDACTGWGSPNGSKLLTALGG